MAAADPDDPTMEEIERAWRRPRSNGRPTGWRRVYYSGLAYYGLVFSYLWRFFGVLIIVGNSWMSLHDPTIRAAWFPLWISALLLVGVLGIGHIIGRLASWWIIKVTGRAPWASSK
ncbi:hypothetical protein [Caulobacter rhizosphaerae]|jgi:hypothetical protein|uniref:2TM domain-containing protein n=1 Tax=Caulobacter rhizosphaerae TaxID=2010972 RepID=A0ABU1N107_9CAUL|nr:hypothetical protein [Caulobacter rhizosphaerae]MDR6531806.1 hypothetical protein [Caulobacter rhizosphaerae]GGL49257.1 hypothetical protein GCM10010983_53260 [Caulobacter rhizosphaerae]